MTRSAMVVGTLGLIAALAACAGVPRVDEAGLVARARPASEAVLAFAAGSAALPAGRHRVFVSGLDASGITPLSPAGTADQRMPAWSPDGDQMVISEANDDQRYDLILVTLPGATVRRLTDTPGWDEVDPAWSPDGERIAFASNRLGAWSLMVMAADGGVVTPMTSSATDSRDPAWSPDGRSIAYRCALTDGQSELCIMSVAGGDPRQLTMRPETDDTQPAWSPDGRTIAFVSRPLLGGGDGDLWLTPSDAPLAEPVIVGSGDAFDPAWAPDGRLYFAAIGAPDVVVTPQPPAYQVAWWVNAPLRAAAAGSRQPRAPGQSDEAAYLWVWDRANDSLQRLTSGREPAIGRARATATPVATASPTEGGSSTPTSTGQPAWTATATDASPTAGTPAPIGLSIPLCRKS